MTENTATNAKPTMLAAAASTLVFFVNGKKVVDPNPDPECTLLTYLRDKLRLCGTKLGCGEGGCGACTVMISRMDRHSNTIKNIAVNACLTPVCAMHGHAVTTVEGIGSTRTRLHPVQERLAKAHGSQCGFCTPGIVMSMYTLLRNSPQPSMKDLEVTFQGNLCRCTGYRPILEGYKTFTKEFSCAMGDKCCKVNGNKCGENGVSVLDDKLFDKSEFVPFDPSQEPIFPPELHLNKLWDIESLIFKGERVTWYRPGSLEELLQLKSAFPHAKLVVGNTEVGVEIKFKHFLYPVLINPTKVPHMTEVVENEDSIYFGAAVSLIDIEKFLRKSIATLPENQVRFFQCAVDMLHYFAGKQIRSVASLGGNIMTGSPISDMNPVLMAGLVKLKVAKYDGTKPQYRNVVMDSTFFTGYRRNVLEPQEVLVGIYFPKTLPNQYVVAFKQARRRDDDIAIVNTAVNVIFEPKSNIIQKVTMAFGGMAPTTIMAVRSCEMMVQQQWNRVLVERVVENLCAELPLAPSAPGGMIAYRRSLVVSLFFKAFLKITRQLMRDGIVSEDSLSPEELSGSDVFHTPVLKSAQLFEKVSSLQSQCDPIGRPKIHASAFKQVTGEAIYCDDIPRMENELYLALVLSTKAHAKLLNIDASEALAMPGVHAFFSSKDVTRHQNEVGPVFHDEVVFASDVVYCQGQVIGAVVADNQALAQRAARKVKVTYEDLSPVIVTIEEAISHKSFFPGYPHFIEVGDIETAFKEADHIYEGTCRMGGQEHFYFETHASLAMPRDWDEIELISSTQHPSEVQKLVAHVLSVPAHKVVCKAKRLGGGFGGKESRSISVALPVALACHRLRRPVRCMLDRDEDMMISGTRHPFLYKYKIAFTSAGRLTACYVECYANTGWSLDLSFSVLDRCMYHIENCYKIPNIKVGGWLCKTNLPSNTAFRGFGGPQGMFAAENIIRDIARILDKDVVDIMNLNFYKPGDVTHYNQKIDDFPVLRCFKDCLKQSRYCLKKQDVDNFNRSNRWRKRGISVVPTKYGIAFGVEHLNQSGALIHIYGDGSVLLSHGGVEIGQGVHTKMIQCCARALQIPFELIHISETSTDKVPNTPPTAGSMTSDLNGMAVLDACAKLNKRLEPIKKANPNGTWQEWINKAYFERVSLSATGFYKLPGVGYHPVSNPNAQMYSYFTTGVGVSVVEIDCLTGDHQVLTTDIVMDIGSSLNPAIDIGQIEGAFMQGYGLFTLEELIYSPQGALYSRGPGMYKLPGFADIPGEFNVTLLTGAPNPRAVYSSKAVGEPPLFIGSTAFFAIKEAISAARVSNGLDKHFNLESPATSARIRMACQDNLTKLVVDPNPDPECTLLTYLRDKLRLCGTKLGCGEGGCGACTVMISRMDRHSNTIKNIAVNACLTPVCAMHGHAVTTVEGIGSTRTRLHPVQERLAKAHGSQCGFCTPGIVMSMYTLLRNSPQPSMKDLEVTFQGNLCRCTGYRPILEGYKTFTKEFSCAMGDKCCKVNGNKCGENGVSVLDDKLFDKSEFVPFDPSQEPIFPPELHLNKLWDIESLIFKGERVTWYRPGSLEELLQLKSAFPHAKLVVGNTEVGVEIKFKHFLYPVLINPTKVPHMTEVVENEDSIYFGAAVSLIDIEKFLRKSIATLPENQVRFFQCAVDMLHYFAGKQIRSVASLGGNIMTGSPISDMNPVLMAGLVKLKVAKYDGTKPQYRNVVMDSTFFTGYRRNVLEPQEVLVGIYFPKTLPNQYVVAFKQARRRDDDIAIVNTAVNVIFEPKSNIIQKVTMAFGGMAPTTIMAVRSCEMMVQQQWNRVLVERVVENLCAELPLAPSAPGGMIAYRRSLVVSLFFKAFLKITRQLMRDGIVSEDSLSPEELSGSDVFHTPVLKSAQLFEKVSSLQSQCDPIGRPKIHASAFKQVTGEAIYCDDIPRMENELYLALVLSTKAHAKLLNIDASEALAMPGVHAFFSSKDVTRHQNEVGPVFHDEVVFASDVVYCQGQVIGAVVADNQALAQRAARKVKVTYEDLSPVIVTIEEAISHKSFFPGYPHFIEVGDIETAFKEADHIYEGTCRMGGQEHFYFETHASLAMPRDWDEIELISSTQHPSEVQKLVAHVLSVPAHKVVCKAKRLGGGFGGKESRSISVTLPVALACHRLRRPVRCMLDRDKDMMISGTRHPFLYKYKIAFTSAGRLTACYVECYANTGWSLDLSFSVLDRCMYHIENCYKIPNIKVGGWLCKTNLPSNTAFRGFGGPQGMFAAENIIRDIARILDKDVVDIMNLNFYKPGDVTHYNQKIDDFPVLRCFKDCLKQSRYCLKKQEVDNFNRSNRWRKRGISVVPTKYGIAFGVEHLNQSGALIHIYGDGSVLLSHGGVEIGQGVHTKMIQCCARALQIPFELIHISETSTDKVPNTPPTAGSMTSDLNGMAVLDACAKLNKRLEPIKKANPNGTWQEWINKAYFERVSLSATGFYKLPGVGYHPVNNPNAQMYSYFTTGVGVSVVEIDCLTGDHQVLTTDIVMDIGSSLNPAIDIGQIEGAFMQGYGLFTLEELIYSPQGALYSRGPGMYKLPGFADIPGEFNVTLLTGAPNPRAVYSSKAVGEPPLFIGSTAFFAIKEAISAARVSNGMDKHFNLESPATSARIRMACQDNLTKLIDEPAADTYQAWNVVP